MASNPAVCRGVSATLSPHASKLDFDLACRQFQTGIAEIICLRGLSGGQNLHLLRRLRFTSDMNGDCSGCLLRSERRCKDENREQKPTVDLRHTSGL
jgi:hypothetical protein